MNSFCFIKMKTIKSCTDVEQSRKLIRMLPIDSPDTYIDTNVTPNYIGRMYIDEEKSPDMCIESMLHNRLIPSWSLSALLAVLPNVSLNFNSATNNWWIHIYTREQSVLESGYDNPIDACVKIIETLFNRGLL